MQAAPANTEPDSSGGRSSSWIGLCCPRGLYDSGPGFGGSLGLLFRLLCSHPQEGGISCLAEFWDHRLLEAAPRGEQSKTEPKGTHSQTPLLRPEKRVASEVAASSCLRAGADVVLHLQTFPPCPRPASRDAGSCGRPGGLALPLRLGSGVKVRTDPSLPVTGGPAVSG